MDREDHDLRDRLRAFLGRAYPVNGAKLLARDVDCDPRAAKNYFQGHWPGAEVWKGLVRRFGRDILDAVFAPEIDLVVARLTEEERTLAEQLAAVRARRLAAEGDRPGLPPAVDGAAPRRGRAAARDTVTLP